MGEAEKTNLMAMQVSRNKFSHMEVLHSSDGVRLYRLLYPNSVAYLQRTPERIQFLDQSGMLRQESLEPLLEKVEVHERLFGDSLVREDLSDLLPIDEVSFLLDELSLNHPDLERKLDRRLRSYLQQQYTRRFHMPLTLPRLLERNEFVYNYLQTNIGLPDDSDNYFNKLREMIDQIEEQTRYAEPNYLELIRALLVAVVDWEGPVAVTTSTGYCIVKGSVDLASHHFHGKGQLPKIIQSVPLTNELISQLIQYYRV